MAVQNATFTPVGYQAGQGGSNVSVPSPVEFTEMYGYTQAGLTNKKRLQVNETFHWYVNNIQQLSAQTLNLDAAYTYDIEGKMTSVNYPTTWSWNGTQLVSAAGPTYTYSFDAMDRPTGLKDQNNATAVSNVSYNPANQLSGITYFGTVESRQYNNMNQMTSLTVGSDTITYTFPAGTNNGKISSQTDSVSGETVTYQYDSLNRLLSASSNQGWSETYGFDGFGNLVSKTPTGGAPPLSQAVDGTTNRIVGQSYDANGNQTSGGYGYDAENRLVSATGVQYAYDSRNKRVWKSVLSGGNLTQEVYFYGVDGQKLGTYGFSLMLSPGSVMTDSASSLAVFFGGKRVGITSGGTTTAFKQNRLGSNQGFQFYPYGEARGTAPADTVGFATYTRDSATGLDYADQRYYASNFGRFMSPDPYKASPTSPSDPGNPQSWNRYPYVLGDPANLVDPSGEDWTFPDNLQYIACLFGAPMGSLIDAMARAAYCGATNTSDGKKKPVSEGFAQDQRAAAADDAKAAGCKYIPNGEALGANSSVGAILGVTGGGEIVVNFDTGDVSLYGYWGVSANNGGGSISGTVGYVWNLGDPSSYSGPFANASVSFGPVSAFGSFSSISSDMLNPLPIDVQKPFVIGVAAGKSLLPSAVPIQVGSTTYSKPVVLGNLFSDKKFGAAVLATQPDIFTLVVLRAWCAE